MKPEILSTAIETLTGLTIMKELTFLPNAHWLCSCGN